VKRLSHGTKPGIEWRAEIPASLNSIEQFCREFRTWRASACAEVCAFDAELLLREGLTNSVVHGCAEDPAKRIWCVLRVKPGRLLIAIRDTGDGFDWRAASNRQTDVWEIHSRGLEIFKAYASSVRFNAKGNSLVIVKQFKTGEMNDERQL
jgi:anti-sigma regulatory factor (Ser/Thr protein kinase)